MRAINYTLMEAAKYGPTGDGGYNTPYATTVFYREDNMFQVAIAALTEQCQAIPIVPGSELTLGDVCEHPSPQLIVFADTNYTHEHFRAYFKRGFQKIHVFTEAGAAAGPTVDAGATINHDIASTNIAGTSPATNIAAIAALDDRISLFSLGDMNNGYLSLIPNLTTVYIMELITSGMFPEYKSFMRTITHERGRELLCYLTYTCPTARERGAKLISLAIQFNGYECAEKLCERWRGIVEEREMLARKTVESSPVVGDILYRYNNCRGNELISAASQSQVKYIAIWNWDGSSTKVSVIAGAKWSSGDKEPAELMKNKLSAMPPFW